MRKLLFGLLLLCSCNSASKETSFVENSDAETTLEILSSVDTTLEVCLLDDAIYILKDDKVVYKNIYASENFSVVIDQIIVILWSAITIALFVIFLINLFP